MAGADATEFRRRVDDAVLVLFALVAESVGWATTALLDQDVDRANQVIEDDHSIDERCTALAALVKERLLGSPLDVEELENLVAIIQMTEELERSADLAEHIAQRALRNLGGTITPKSRGLIQAMADIAVRMWREAGSAYRQRSREASFRLGHDDDELDSLAAALVREGVENGGDASVAVELGLIARFYERLGDHAVNLTRRIDGMAAPRRLSGPRSLLRSRASAPKVPGEKRGLVRGVLRGLGGLKLAPSDDAFFDLFQAGAVNARDCAEVLAKLITSSDDIDDQVEQVRGFERRGDQLTIDLLRRLDASFVTPYDREDIHALAEVIDDVVDDMFSAASLIPLARDDEQLPELPELAETLVAMADEMVALMGCLQTRDGARFRLERIEQLERQGDAIHRRSMQRLFSGEYEALHVIKWKDIVGSLEAALNAIEDVSDVVESILVKNS
jgi:predicted phosphate transport protein (TIGR00153 family)